jgi:hypothetical protein
MDLVSASLGIVSFVITVRNTIDKILKDIDAVERHAEELVPLRNRIGLCRDKLRIWKYFWQVHKRTPDQLFIAYWGDRGSQDIGQLLSYLSRDSLRIREEFRSKYSEIAAGPSFRYLSDEPVLQSLSREWKHDKAQLVNKLKRLCTALFTGETFQRHLKSFEDNIELLQDESKTTFIAINLAYKDVGWKKDVLMVTNKVHLIELASKSTRASEALRRICVGMTDHTIDYQLGHATSFDRRMETLSESVRSGHLTYHLSAAHSSAPTDILGVYCQETRRSAHDGDDQFSRALQRLFRDRAADQRIYLRPEGTSISFVFGTCPCTCYHSHSLRSLMMAPNSEEDDRQYFLSQERPLLAYELAECALLFLKTGWFCDLCSCSVLRTEDRAGRTSFMIRISGVHHVDAKSGEPAEQRQWCETSLRNMHIRRLGLLLTEISLQTAVKNAVYDEARTEIGITLGLNHVDPATTSLLGLREIGKRVRRATSEDFREAVQYCLKNGTAARDICQQDLDYFYDIVVAP